MQDTGVEHKVSFLCFSLENLKVQDPKNTTYETLGILVLQI